MGEILSTIVGSKRTSPKETTRTSSKQIRLENIAELFRYGEKGEIVICPAAADTLEDELRNFVDNLPSNSSISTEIIKNLLEKPVKCFADRRKETKKRDKLPAELIRYGETGEIVICPAAAETLEKELRNCKLPNRVADRRKETKQPKKLPCGPDKCFRTQETQTDSIEQNDASCGPYTLYRTQETQTLNREVYDVGIQTLVPLESWQVGAVLEVMKNIRASVESVQYWIRAIGENKVLNYQLLKAITGKLELHSHVGHDNDSIVLSQSEVDRILQNIKDYLSLLDERERKKNLEPDTNDYNTKEKTGVKPIETHASSKQRQLNMQVQIVDPLPSKTNELFYEALQKWMENHGINLVKLQKNAVTELLSGSNSIIVICTNHSRLHANATNTLANVHEGNRRRIFLLVLRCQREKYLSSISSKSELLESGDFQELDEIVDFAFNKDEGGIYECEMNKRAFKTVAEFIANGKLVVGGKPDKGLY